MADAGTSSVSEGDAIRPLRLLRPQKKPLVFAAEDMLVIVILFICSKYKVFWWLLKEWNGRIWIVPQRRQFLVLLYLLIQNMCNSKLQSSNIVGDLVIVTVIGLGAPTCNIVGDLVTSRRSGVSLPQTKYMHRSDTSAGWQDLAGFRRGQKWPWNLSSSAYLQFSRQMRRFCA